MAERLTDVLFNRLSEDPCLALVDAFLYMWDFWGYEYSYSFSVYLPIVMETLYIGGPLAYMAALLQRTATHEYADITDFERLALSLMADYYIQTLLNTADFSMGIPLWVWRNTIFLTEHIFNMYGIIRYREYGGRIEVPSSRLELVASIALFEERRAADEPNRFYASGFWVYRDIYETERIRADMQDVVLIAVTTRELRPNLTFRAAIHALIHEYQANESILSQPGNPAQNQAELNAWMLYAYVSYLR